MSKRRQSGAAEPKYEARLPGIEVIRRTDSRFGKAGDVEDHSDKVIHDGQVSIKVSEVASRSKEERALLFTLPKFKEWYDDALKRWEQQQKGD